MAVELDEETMQDLYAWVDKIPLSRPKKNITRDFSDGVLAAEVVKFHFPKLVEMHNYVPANSTQQKLNNWGHLNRKVFNKLNFSIPEDVIRKITQCSPGVVELVLNTLRQKIEEKQKQKQHKTTSSSQEMVHYPAGEHNHAEKVYSPAPLRTRNNLTGHNPQNHQGTEHSSQSLNEAHPTRRADVGNGIHLVLQEKEQALLASQETIQILQAKVRRLEHLVQLKDVRIDDLTRRLQQMEQNQPVK